MDDLERKARNCLVLDFGFSRRNAEVALKMFREGELNNTEAEVIYTILLNPNNVYKGIKSFIELDRVMGVAGHLNYKITLAGGDARSKSRLR